MRERTERLVLAPEHFVFLAREAELPYATLAMVTDYDCWRAETEAVTVTNVLEVMHRNSALARRAIVRLAEALESVEESGAKEAWLTHLTHEFDAETLQAQLPENIHVAWDGLRIFL